MDKIKLFMDEITASLVVAKFFKDAQTAYSAIAEKFTLGIMQTGVTIKKEYFEQFKERAENSESTIGVVHKADILNHNPFLKVVMEQPSSSEQPSKDTEMPPVFRDFINGLKLPGEE